MQPTDLRVQRYVEGYVIAHQLVPQQFDTTADTYWEEYIVEGALYRLVWANDRLSEATLKVFFIEDVDF